MAYRGVLQAAKGPVAKPAGRSLAGGRTPGPPAEAPRPPKLPPPKKPPHSSAKSAPPAKALTKAQTLPPSSLPIKKAKVQEAVPSVVVFSTDPSDELGIQALVCGEYVAAGMNHGKRYFKKTRRSPDDEDVHLYYWDEREGESFSGWWFGDSVGGAQVWLHTQEGSPMPPRTGWTWRDGEVREELLVMTPAEKAQYDQENAAIDQGEDYEAVEEMQQTQEGADEEWAEEAYDGEEAEQDQEGVEEERQEQERQEQERQEQEMQERARQMQHDAIMAQWDDRVQRATDEVAVVESDAAQALEMAQLAMDSDLGLNDDSALRAQELLSAQAQPLLEAQRIAATAGLTKPDAPPAVKTAAVELTQRVRTVIANVKAAEKKLASARAERAKREEEEQKRAQEEARLRALEAQHAAQLEEMLRSALDKVNTVEDEVEKVEIAATPLEIHGGDGLQSTMLQAIKETEQHVRTANTALADGRRFMALKVSQAKRLVQGMKSSILDELTALHDKLNEAQTKLTPYLSIRQTYEQRVQAKKVLDDLSEKLATAEIEVERAVIACSPLGGETLEGTKEAEASLIKAGVTLSQASRLIEAKLKAAGKTQGPLLEGLEEMHTRSQQLQEKLQESQQTLKDMKDRAVADALLRDVSEKAESIESELQRMAEAQSMFMEQEEEAGQDAEVAVAEAEKVVVGVQSALTTSQALVKKVQADMGRSPKGPPEGVAEALQLLQQRLEEGKDKLEQFTTGTRGLKRQQLLRVAERAVAAAEADLQRLAEVAASLGEPGASGEPAADSLKEGMQQAIAVERGVQASIVTARKCIVDTSSELRKIPGSASGPAPEIAQLQVRISSVQQEAVRLRNVAKNAEERVKARASLKELIDKVRAAEAEAAEAGSASAALAEETDDAQDNDSLSNAVGQIEKATAAGHSKLAAVGQIVALKLKTARGALKEELEVLQGQLKEAVEKLGSATAKVEGRKQRLQVAGVVAMATKQVELAEAEVQKAAEAELPFLTGVEELASDVAHSAVATCEAAVKIAQKVIGDARAYVAKTHVDMKRLSSQAYEACSGEFVALQDRLNVGVSKLVELSKDMLERRRGMQQQLSAEKLSKVEAIVQKLASISGRFADDKLDALTSDEARTVCEELAGAETEAHAVVKDAKDFLAESMKQAKGQPDARAVSAESAKSLAKLRQHELELARLLKESQFREQRYVAQQMLKEVPQSLAKLDAEVEASHKTASLILAADRNQVLEDLRVQSVLASLRAHISTEGVSAAALFAQVTEGETATPEELAAFLDRLPYPGSSGDAGPRGIPGLSGEQAASALATAAQQGGEDALSAAGLQALLRERWICRARAPATDASEGGALLTNVEAGEVVEVLARSEGAEGATRAQCVLARDGATLWLTLSGPNGGSDFEPCLTSAGRTESIAAYIEGVCTRCAEVAQDAVQKAEMCATHGQQQGPLADVRSKLLQLKMKANVHQMKMEQLKKRVLSAKAALTQKWEEAQQKAQASHFRATVEKQVKEAVAAVESSEAKAQQVVDGVKAGKMFKAQKAEDGTAHLDAAKKTASEALQALAEAKGFTSNVIKEHESQQGALRSVVLDVRVQLMKLMSRLTSMERKCRMAVEVLGKEQLLAARRANEQARQALRAAALRSGHSADELFERYAEGGEELSEDQLGALVESLPGHNLERAAAVRVLRAGAPEDRGLRRFELAQAIQEFHVCVKAIAITEAPKIVGAGLVRMLELGEFFEIIDDAREQGAADGKSDPLRLRGRALRDGTEGWVTTKGNKGTVYMQPAQKPFMRCASETTLREGRDMASSVVARARCDDVLELLEGPREDAVEPELLLHGHANGGKDEGWITLRNALGGVAAAPSQGLLVCRTAIAMTDVFDINKCGIVRKVAVGEILEALGDEPEQEGGPQQEREDSSAGVARRRFKALRDGATGWITVRGTQGTVYLEASTSHYVVQQRTALRSAREASAVVRWLEAGETFEATGAPEEGSPLPPMQSVRVRAASGGVSGWASWSKTSEAPLQLQS